MNPPFPSHDPIDRQLELIQKTAAELEALKKEIEENKGAENDYRARFEQEKTPLLEEIVTLQHTVRKLEDSKNALYNKLIQLEDEFQSYHSHVQNIFSSTTPVSVSAPREIRPEPAVAQAVSLPPEEKKGEKNNRKEKSDRKPVAADGNPSSPKPKRRLKRLVFRLASWGIIAAIGYGGWGPVRAYLGQQAAGTDSGSVAGVSTTAPSAATAQPATPTPTPDESALKAIVSFDETNWKHFKDPVNLKIAFDWPENASLLKYSTSDPDHVWLLRGDGYNFKVESLAADGTLDAYMNAHQDDYPDYAFTQGSFKGNAAWMAKTKYTSAAPGNYIFVQPFKAGPIYSIWYRSEAPNSDDFKRLQKVVDSLQFVKD